MGEDYYAILELQRGASEADIKKAYRRMAIRWQLDKNQDNKSEADRRCKEISEAYKVLSDPSKRQIYDVYGKAGLENGGGGGGHGGGSSGTADPGSRFGFVGGSSGTADPGSRFGFVGGSSGIADPGSRFGFGGGGFADLHNGSFAFHDPQEVFREFFGGRVPFADPLEGIRQHHNHHHQQQQQQLFQSTFVDFPTRLHDPFSAFGPFAGGSDSVFPARNGAQTLSFGPSTQFRSSTTSTRVVNGRQIVTKKVVENGVETVTVTENGVVTQRTVNGRTQSIEGQAAAALATIGYGAGGGGGGGGPYARIRSAGGPYARIRRAGGPYARIRRAGGLYARIRRAGGPYARIRRAGGPYARIRSAGGRRSALGHSSRSSTRGASVVGSVGATASGRVGGSGSSAGSSASNQATDCQKKKRRGDRR